MKILSKRIIPCMLVLALALSIVSAQPNFSQSRALPHIPEAQIVGGKINCAAVFGLTMGLTAAAFFSPCSVLCGTAAMHSLLLLSQC
jgi:hypothetical protein